MKLWFNNKKNAVLALRRLFRDGVDLKQFDRSEVRVVPVEDPTGRSAQNMRKQRLASGGYRYQDSTQKLGYHLEIPGPTSSQHAMLLQQWAHRQPGGNLHDRGMAFARSESEERTLFHWRKGRAYVNDSLMKKQHVYEPAALKQEIKNLDSMIGRQKPLKRAVTVYRGVSARLSHEVGDVITMRQYVSTSRSAYVAATVFTNRDRHQYDERWGYKIGYKTNAPNGTFYRIICVPGTKLLNPGNDRIPEIKGGSMQELILPRNQQFKVVSKDGVNAYTLETIPSSGGMSFAFAFQSEGSRLANPIPAHPELSPEERFAIAQKSAEMFNRKDARRGRLRKLKLKQLRSVQPTVDPATVASYKKRRKPIKVAKIKGHWTILDGNHCAAECARAGDQDVAVEEFTAR